MLFSRQLIQRVLLGAVLFSGAVSSANAQTTQVQQQTVTQPVYPQQVQQVYPQVVPVPQYQVQQVYPQMVPMPSIVGTPTVTYQQIPVPNYQVNPYVTQQIPSYNMQQQVPVIQQGVTPHVLPQQQQQVQQPQTLQQAVQSSEPKKEDKPAKETTRESEDFSKEEASPTVAESKIFTNEAIEKPRNKVKTSQDGPKAFTFSSRDVFKAKETKRNIETSPTAQYSPAERIRLSRGLTSTASAQPSYSEENVPEPRQSERIGSPDARKSFKPVSARSETVPKEPSVAEKKMSNGAIDLTPLLNKQSPDQDYETCTKVINKTVAGASGSCFKITMAHSCQADRYMIMCSHTANNEGCRMTSRPVPPNTNYDFMLCLPNNFLLRHAACSTVEGCKDFEKKDQAIK